MKNGVYWVIMHLVNFWVNDLINVFQTICVHKDTCCLTLVSSRNSKNAFSLAAWKVHIFFKSMMSSNHFTTRQMFTNFMVLIKVDPRLKDVKKTTHFKSYGIFILITYLCKEVNPQCALLTWGLTLSNEMLRSYRESYLRSQLM